MWCHGPQLYTGTASLCRWLKINCVRNEIFALLSWFFLQLTVCTNGWSSCRLTTAFCGLLMCVRIKRRTEVVFIRNLQCGGTMVCLSGHFTQAHFTCTGRKHQVGCCCPVGVSSDLEPSFQITWLNMWKSIYLSIYLNPALTWGSGKWIFQSWPMVPHCVFFPQGRPAESAGHVSWLHRTLLKQFGDPLEPERCECHQRAVLRHGQWLGPSYIIKQVSTTDCTEMDEASGTQKFGQ